MSTLQYYFGNREDLLLATFRHVCDRELAAMTNALGSSDDPWQQLVNLVRVGVADDERPIDTWRTWVEFWRAGLRDSELREEAHAIYRQWREFIGRVLSDGVASGRFSNTLDVEIISFQLTALVDGIGIPVALADPGFCRDRSTAVTLVTDALARLIGVQSEEVRSSDPTVPSRTR